MDCTGALPPKPNKTRHKKIAQCSVWGFTREDLQKLVEQLKAVRDPCPATKPKKYGTKLTIQNPRSLT